MPLQLPFPYSESSSRPAPDALSSLVVEQQPVRARMCGFGDKVSHLHALDACNASPVAAVPRLRHAPMTGPPSHHASAVHQAGAPGRQD